MNKSNLKKLAAFGDVRLEEERNSFTGKKYLKEFQCSDEWNPVENSRQLNMLEDKMIEEIENFVTISISKYPGKFLYNVDSNKRIVHAEGKTKNEACANGILNYINI